MQVILPLFSRAVAGKRFHFSQVNPGVGGTEFLTVQLAIYLAEQNPHWSVSILSSENFTISNRPSNLNIWIISLQDIRCFAELRSSDSVFIMPANFFVRVGASKIDEVKCKKIMWLYHPFERRKEVVRAKVDAFVSVGEYQFYSNYSISASHWHIQNLFFGLGGRYNKIKKIENMKPEIVYLGALVPAKGFHLLASQWRGIKKVFPDANLSVIGSAETYYGKQAGDLHACVPAAPNYGAKLFELIGGEDISMGRVKFHGNMGVEKRDVIMRADIGVLNPFGLGEAFPGSILEIMSMGKPVITACDYGFFDVMKNFPEAAIKSPIEIADKMHKLLGDQRLYEEYSQLSVYVAQSAEAKNASIISRWARLIDIVASQNFVGRSGPADPLIKYVPKIFYRSLRKSVHWQRKSIFRLHGEPKP